MNRIFKAMNGYRLRLAATMFLIVIMAGGPAITLASVVGNQPSNTIGGDKTTLSHPLTLSVVVPEGDKRLPIDVLDGLEGDFNDYTSSQPSFGFTKGTAYIRVNIKADPQALDNRYVLYVDYALLDRISLFEQTLNGLELRYHTGDSMPFSSRPIENRAFAFPILIPQGDTKSFYIEAFSRDTLQIPVQLYTEEEFQRHALVEQYVLGMFFGGVFMMTIFISCLYVILKDNAIIFMAFFLLCVAGVAGSINGIASQWFFTSSPVLAKEIRILWLGYGIFSTVLFAMTFLKTKIHIPRLHQCYRILAITSFFIPILSVVVPFYYSIQIVLLVCLLTSLMVVITSFIMLGKDYPPAKFYFLAWVWFVLGAVTIIARAFSIIPNNTLTEFGFQVGSLVCIISLALGIASKFNMERTNRLKLEKIAGDEKEARLTLERNSRALLEEKVAERTRDLSIANKEVEDAIQAKSQFLAAASHDLRQPLHAACLLATLIGKKVDKEEDKELVVSLNHSLTGLSDLFTSLLDVSILDAGTLEINIQAIFLNDIFDALVLELSETVQQKGIELVVRCQPVIVQTDPVLFSRILRNIIVNAVTHSSATRILLVGRQYKGKVRVVVMDNGVGIPNTDIQQIFKEFYRNKTKKSTGLGLGLSIVKKLCVLLDHDIETRSIESKGVEFVITLPLIKKISQNNVPNSIKELPLEKNKYKLLFLDDDASIVDAMTKLLSEVGYQIRSACCIDDAVTILDSGYLPDLLISDYHLDEERTGVDAISVLSSMLSYPVATLMLTGETSSDTLEKIKSSKILCMHKPVNIPKLMMMIESLLLETDD